MLRERQYFVCGMTSFSVNAHGLRHVTDQLSLFIYVSIGTDRQCESYSFGSVYSLATTRTDAVYACLGVLCLDTLIPSRLTSGYFQQVIRCFSAATGSVRL